MPAAVRIHVATLDTAAATELCIRTIHRFAGMPFDLVIGDGGSTDGSLARFRRLERAGWLHLEVAPEGRRHAEWLNVWSQECPARYAVFVDSDMQFLRPNWLADLVAEAERTHAAMVTSRIQRLEGDAHTDRSGKPMRWAPRPTPWLIFVDLEQIRGTVETGFGFRFRDDPDHPGSRIAYDTGAAFFEELQARGLAWSAMPDAWSDCYRHYGGMTWVRNEPMSRSRRVKVFGKGIRIRANLVRARLTSRRPRRG